MNTTVTGLFPNHEQAALAAERLARAGFAADQVNIVDADTPTRYEFIDNKTIDTRRGVLLGLVFGCTGGIVAGTAMAGIFGFVRAAAVGGLAAAAGGALLGLLVGRVTRSQVRSEMEHQVDAGSVLVSVTAQCEHEPVLMNLLAQGNGSMLVTSTASFTAGVLPVTPPPAADPAASLAP